jgi:hypothetical protein
VEQLPAPGERLRLPEGWQYRVRILPQDLVVRPCGDADIAFDEHATNHQREGG